jgi:hypothetical protein
MTDSEVLHNLRSAALAIGTVTGPAQACSQVGEFAEAALGTLARIRELGETAKIRADEAAERLEQAARHTFRP